MLRYYIAAHLYHFLSSVVPCNVFYLIGFCVDKAKEFGLITVLAENISRENNEKALVMELAVMAAFGVNG